MGQPQREHFARNKAFLDNVEHRKQYLIPVGWRFRSDLGSRNAALTMHGLTDWLLAYGIKAHQPFTRHATVPTPLSGCK